MEGVFWGPAAHSDTSSPPGTSQGPSAHVGPAKPEDAAEVPVTCRVTPDQLQRELGPDELGVTSQTGSREIYGRSACSSRIILSIISSWIDGQSPSGSL